MGAFYALTTAGTPKRVARLVPAVEAALGAGWTPQALAAFTDGNAGGVRSPYAVLASRLSPAELPAVPRSRPRRPPWCGAYDEGTRMLGYDGDAPRPCPKCKQPGDSAGITTPSGRPA